MGELNSWLIGGGLTVGIIFGMLVQRYRFCMVAATSNLLLIKDWRHALAFVAALLVAITGTQLLEITETVNIARSAYRNSQLDWFGAVFGGVIFGIGATLAGGCAARTVIRSAEGNLNAILVLISFALFAAFAQFGFLESTRLGLTHLTATGLTTDAGIASMLSLPKWLVALVVVAGLLAVLIKFWQSEARNMVIAGAVIGALVVVSWYITGVIAQDEFDPKAPSAITVSGPMARFGYIVISGATPAFSFAISFVIGLAVGALVISLLTRQFRIEPIVKGRIGYSVLGGALMGIGGVVAYGCNVGQGLSGISTLSFESLLAFVGMFAGTALTVKWMEKYTSL